MIDFDYVKARDVERRRQPDRAEPGGEIHRRRHQSHRSDEGERRASHEADRHHRPAARPRLRRRRPEVCGSVRSSPTATSPMTRGSRSAIPSFQARSLPEHLPSSATWPRPEAISCSGRAACISMTPTPPCNKREPGSGCDAIGGFNRMNAILGWSETCIAVHPSDLCVALAALEAIVHVSGSKGDRAIPFADFHRLPGDTPQIDTNLARDEIIIAIELPPEGFPSNYSYLKIRDRLSYAFALVSVAAGLKIEGGAIKDARVALGGVAHKPWRVPDAERRLVGQQPSRKRSAMRPISFCRAPKALPITASRSSSRGARSCARSSRRRLEHRNLSP